MKIYKHEPKLLFRIWIAQKGQKPEYLTISDCNIDELKYFFKVIISGNMKNDPFAKGNRTSINIREAIGGKNLKQESLSFIGLTPKQTFDLINEKLK